MQKLTEKEQKIIKDIFPHLKEGQYDTAFAKIAGNIPTGIVLGISSVDSYDVTFNIINFLKYNGIELLHKVEMIPPRAFLGCNKLHEIVVPGNITTVSVRACESCKNLKSVVIQEGVRRLFSASFMGCINLNSVIIPKSAIYIGDDAFGNCPSLEKITYKGTQEEWNKIHIERYYLQGSFYLNEVECLDGSIQL